MGTGAAEHLVIHSWFLASTSPQTRTRRLQTRTAHRRAARGRQDPVFRTTAPPEPVTRTFVFVQRSTFNVSEHRTISAPSVVGDTKGRIV